MNQKNIDSDERDRIAISIGLIAGFLTIIYSLEKFLPETGTIFSLWIKTIIDAYFGIAVFSFLLFLLFRGIHLKYRSCGNLDIFGIKLPIRPLLYKSFFDFGIDLALISPLLAGFVVYNTYIPSFLASKTKWHPEILALIIFVIIGFVLLFGLDYLSHRLRENNKNNRSRRR